MARDCHRPTTISILFSRRGENRRRKISREQYFAGGKFREIPCAVDIYFAGGKFRAKSKFANIAKISSTRKIRVIQYLEVEYIRNVLSVSGTLKYADSGNA